MRVIPTISSIVIAVLLSGFVPSSDTVQFSMAYIIEPQSNLYLKGTTNVNSFQCVALDVFKLQELRGTFDPQHRRATFNGAKIQLQVAKLDCNNSKINKDLCEALNSQRHPTIGIVLHSAEMHSDLLSNTSIDIVADATLRINGVQRRVKLHVKGRQLSDDGFQFISDTRIRMTDFGVEPPTALFGLIKVDDEVTIHLDIVTRAVMKQG